MKDLKITGTKISEKVRIDFLNLKESQGHGSMGETLQFLLNFYENENKKIKTNINNDNLSAFGRIDLFVNTIMKHNENKDSDKFFIGASFVRKELGVNMNALNIFFKSNKKKIEVHHKKNNISKDENFKFRALSKKFRDVYKRDENKRMKIIVEILKNNNVYDTLIKQD